MIKQKRIKQRTENILIGKKLFLRLNKSSGEYLDLDESPVNL